MTGKTGKAGTGQAKQDSQNRTDKPGQTNQAGETYLLNCLTQNHCFPPAERLWALKPDFHCGGKKSANTRFFLSRSALSPFFFALSRSFLASRSRARKRKSAKKAPAPTSEGYGYYLDNSSGDIGGRHFTSSEDPPVGDSSQINLGQHMSR